MSDESETLLVFPCDFAIKAFGKTGDAFENAVKDIVMRHVDSLTDDAITRNSSKKAKYTSITVTIQATNKQQIDNIYIDLTADENVVMAL